MHDFDKAQLARHAQNAEAFGERTFGLRGETFHVRANVGYSAIKAMAEINENTEGTVVFERVENAVLAMIDPRNDAHARFIALCRQMDNPITFDDLNDINNWLIQETTQRPPTQQNSSPTGQQTPGTSSTETSSSEPAQASTS